MAAMLAVSELCDACGTPALVTAKRDGQVLAFCRHHGAQHRASLVAQGWVVVDESDRVPARPAPSTAQAPLPPLRSLRCVGPLRNPTLEWLLVAVTFGVYYLVWYHHINRELREFDRTIEVRPGLAVLSQLVPVLGLVSVYRTGQRIRQAQISAGIVPDASGSLGVVTAVLLVMVVPYYTEELNAVWRGR
jgi:hypothetical protein